MQAVIDCYFEEAELSTKAESLKNLPASAVIPALDYFNIPLNLRSPGVRMLMKVKNLRPSYLKHLRQLLKEATQVTYMQSMFGESVSSA